MDKNNSSNIYQFANSIYASHRRIINFVGLNKKIIDVGCNKGYLAQEFKKKGCFVLGIESNKVSAEIAKGLCDEVICEDVERIEQLNYPQEHFDIIVFADILEHLKEPDKTLLKFKKYLKPDGIVIASLPNIARLDIRLKLLCGKFNYCDSGILDKTHLRFFTLSTAKELFIKNGYKIICIDYSGMAARIKILPTYFAFQFIIVVKKIKENKD